MKKHVRTLALLLVPILLSSCSTGKSNSLSEKDLDTVNSFCNDYSKLRDWTQPSVMDMESDYLTNVSILAEKYPDSLELKQLDLSVQLAFEYADWVRAIDPGYYLGFGSLPVEVLEQAEVMKGNNPPAPAKVLTEGIAKSCESFKK